MQPAVAIEAQKLSLQHDRLELKGLAPVRADLRALTGVRFVAASYVVLFHSKFSKVLMTHGHQYLSVLVSHGMFAVQLFFMLSGFILAYTYVGRLGGSGDLRKFWEARFARVWPLYFCSLIASSCLNHTTPAILPAISTLLMIQSWSPFGVQAGGYWNFVCWTLSCEAFFYVVFPFLQQPLRKAGLWAALVGLVICLSLSAVFCIGEISFGSENTPIGLPLAVIRLPDFVAGVCLGSLFLRSKEHIPKLPWSTGVGTIGLVIGLSHTKAYFLAMVPFCFAFLLYGLAKETSIVRTLLSTRGVLIGGAVSYAMYLFQWPLKALVKHVLDQTNIAPSGNLQFFLYILVLIASSCVLYYGIEEPFRKVIRRAFGLRRPKPLLTA